MHVNVYLDVYIYSYLLLVIIVAALTFLVATVVALSITFRKKGKDFLSFFGLIYFSCCCCFVFHGYLLCFF